jgi:hypothetical protein
MSCRNVETLYGERMDMLSNLNQRTATAECEVSQPLKAEIAELRDMSESLVHLAEDHPTVAETLVTIAASVCNSATILAVLLERDPTTDIAPSRCIRR